MTRNLHQLARDTAGAMVIETAFVVPILAILCLGGFEASMLVARDTELQSALAEAEAIAIANAPESQSEVDTIKSILATSTGLDPAQGQVAIARKYRCDTDASLVDSAASCGSGEVVSGYLEITLKDSYTPLWTSFGIGSAVQFEKIRTVQIS